MSRPSRRHHALDAAARLVERLGATPTMEAIAEEAGMSRQALYHHFNGPVDLFVAVVDHVGVTHRRDELVADVLAAGDPDERLVRYIRFLGQYWRGVGRVAVAFEHASRDDPDARPAWEGRMEGLRRVAREVLRGFAARGRLAEGWTMKAATDALWALSGPVHHHLLTVQCGWSRSRYETYLHDTVASVLLTGGAERNR